MALLFVPAGVGVMLHLHRIGDEWLPLATSLVGSTVLAMAAPVPAQLAEIWVYPKILI